MSSQQEPSRREEAPGRQVFRSPGGVILWWIWAAVAALSLGDLAVQGRDHASLVAAALIVAVTGVLYACALRPRIVADADGITVANPVREHRVPWGAVDMVDTRGSVRVHCVAGPGKGRGRVLQSWAVQSSPRSKVRREMADRRAVRRARRRPSQWAGTGRPDRPPAYGRPPARQPDALDRLSADAVVRQLDERLQQAREAGTAPGRPEASWAWAPIAAMLVPLVLLVLAVLL